MNNYNKKTKSLDQVQQACNSTQEAVKGWWIQSQPRTHWKTLSKQSQFLLSTAYTESW